jgi:hypothetical protein
LNISNGLANQQNVSANTEYEDSNNENVLLICKKSLIVALSDCEAISSSGGQMPGTAEILPGILAKNGIQVDSILKANKNRKNRN